VFFDLENAPTHEIQRLESPLSSQMRCISLLPDRSGVILGGVDGDIAVHSNVAAEQSTNFAFTAHCRPAEYRNGPRGPGEPVNAIMFHPGATGQHPCVVDIFFL
jgi:hypothetical protein